MTDPDADGEPLQDASPEDWSKLLAASVWRYLDALHAAGPEASRLAASWRTLLTMHETGVHGACERCRRGHVGACTVWQVAIGYLVRRV